MEALFSHTRRRNRPGFSLIELLVVTAIIAILLVVARPVISHLGPNNLQSAQVKMQGIVEQARQYAQAHRTYVRLGLAQTTAADGSPQVIIQCLSSLTGDLRNDTSPGLNDESQWRSIGRPVILPGLALDDSLLSRLPGTPTANAPDSGFSPFTRRADGQSVTYAKSLQFDPQGQASLRPGSLDRRIAIGLKNPTQPDNPLVVVLSGLTGSVEAFRQENLTP